MNKHVYYIYSCCSYVRCFQPSKVIVISTPNHYEFAKKEINVSTCHLTSWPITRRVTWPVIKKAHLPSRWETWFKQIKPKLQAVYVVLSENSVSLFTQCFIIFRRWLFLGAIPHYPDTQNLGESMVDHPHPCSFTHMGTFRLLNALLFL